MKMKTGLLAGLALSALLTACASPGTRVTTNSENSMYREMARSQQTWCSTFNTTCGCSIDGVQSTCSLAATCMNTGACKPSS